MIRVGMSGFAYASWRGPFYPERARPAELLHLYSERLPAVEINATFRRRPDPAVLSRWRDAVGPDFRFALKANAGITHFRRLRGVADEVRSFVDAAGALGANLGPVLFQVPQNFRFEPDVLASFLAGLPDGPSFVFEPRNASFDDPAFTAMLREHGVAMCLNDERFDPDGYTVTTRIAYLRLRRADYTRGELEARAALVRRLDAGTDDVYVFFMHEENPGAAMQALAFRDMLAS